MQNLNDTAIITEQPGYTYTLILLSVTVFWHKKS